MEKRDAAGRLVARVGMAAGMLEGPCVFYAEDGETVVSRMTFHAGRPVLPDPGAEMSPFPSGGLTATGDAPF
ncbi:hypothetical protein [Azospirillum sp. B510]|uniref:hypothetical protein n=1 Tax=Azospirillum sp. (strain B510) TaxID=137722 RepID=UPI0002F6ABBD|nr:hypothetical protein [Azospirillum sp. B510]